MKGSRVLLLAAGAVQDDGAKLALGVASMLAGAELVRRGVEFVEGDLARQGRPLPPLLAELRGSASRKASVDVVLDLAGFDRRSARRAQHAQRLSKLSSRKLAAVHAVLSEG